MNSRFGRLGTIMMKACKRLWLVGGLLLIVLSGCDRQVLYHAYLALPSGEWAKQDTLSFPVGITDSLLDCEVTVEIRHRNNYPYRNLSLTFSCLSPDSMTLLVDTLSLELADKNGVWKGRGIGSLYQLEKLVDGLLRIDRPGEYIVSLTSLFPDTLLTGLNDFGIELRVRHRYAER